MKVSKKFLKYAGYIAIINTLIFVLCFFAFSYAKSEAQDRFVSKMLDKGIQAEVDQTNLTFEGVHFIGVSLNVKSSKTYIPSIKSTYDLSKIELYRPIVNGNVEDYLSLKKFSKSNSNKKSSKVISVINASINVTFKGRDVKASYVDFSTSDGVVKASSVKVGSSFTLNKATFSIPSKNGIVQEANISFSKKEIKASSKKRNSSVSMPPIDGEYHFVINNITGDFQSSNTHIKIKDRYVNVSTENARIERNGSTLSANEVGVVLSFKNKTAVIHASDFLIKNPMLDSKPITFKEVHLELSKNKEIVAKANIDGVKFTFSFAYESYLNSFKFNLPLTKCSTIVGVLPKAWMSSFGNARYDGRMSINISGTPEDPTVKIFSNCKFYNVPKDLKRKRFTKTFFLENGGVKRAFGPGTKNWAPLNMVSYYLERCLLTTEDGRFYTHKGYDSAAFASLIKSSLEAGEVKRGASTITMQLAKNLWLTRDRTIGRKVQEFFLAQHLESIFSKAEIMELYLNVIEFGPNVYGIYDASMYYFNIPPIDLTLKQSLFLSSILPSPNASYFNSDGVLNNGTNNKLNYLLKIMNIRRKIDGDELLEGSAEILNKQ